MLFVCADFGGSTPAPTSISPWKAAWCSTPHKWHRCCVRYRDKRSEIWAHGHTGAPRAKPSKSVDLGHFASWKFESSCQFNQKRPGFSMCFILPQIRTSVLGTFGRTNSLGRPGRVTEGRVFTTCSGLLKPFNKSKVASSGQELVTWNMPSLSTWGCTCGCKWQYMPICG